MAFALSEKKCTTLTEAAVLARTKAPNLESVRKLNCWATHIKDASIVRDLPNLEVCNLSVNNITSLEDFSHCPNLSELYIRKNRIEHLSDIHYLRRLHKLRFLWLADNPCATGKNYRLTVLRTLPNLHKLDNIAVTEEEINKALEEGDELPLPEGLDDDDDMSPSMSGLDLNTNALQSSNHYTNNGSSYNDQSSADAELQEEEEGESDSGVEVMANHSRLPEVSPGMPSFGAHKLDKAQMESIMLSVEETNQIREKLGLKPLPATGASTSKSRDPNAMKARSANVLQSVLLLIRELDKDSLEIVYNTIGQRLQDM